MRSINYHKISINDKLEIQAMDEPGSGGANHLYRVSGFNPYSNPSFSLLKDSSGQFILFQQGPIPQNGVNGLTIEALLAIAMDRLVSFQAGPFSCRSNQMALDHIEEAMHWLQSRTIKRQLQNVEGLEVAHKE